MSDSLETKKNWRTSLFSWMWTFEPDAENDDGDGDDDDDDDDDDDSLDGEDGHGGDNNDNDGHLFFPPTSIRPLGRKVNPKIDAGLQIFLVPSMQI